MPIRYNCRGCIGHKVHSDTKHDLSIDYQRPNGITLVIKHRTFKQVHNQFAFMQQHIPRTINMSTVNMSCTVPYFYSAQLYMYKELGYISFSSHIQHTSASRSNLFRYVTFTIIATTCNSRIASNIGAFK